MEWTDDLTVRPARGTSALDLVSSVRAADERGTRRREVLTVLTERYGLPFDDARLAMDRVRGGGVRASSGNPANAPDKIKDPLAWISYRLELGLPVDEDAVVEPSAEQRAAAAALVAAARRGEPARGTEDVVVALEVARVAVESQEPGRTRFHLLMEAATCLSVAAEACIDRLGRRPCAPEGSQEWVDGVALAAAARDVTATFRPAHTDRARPDPRVDRLNRSTPGRVCRHRTYRHGGGWAGLRVLLARIPDLDAGLAVIAPADNTDRHIPLADALLDELTSTTPRLDG